VIDELSQPADYGSQQIKKGISPETIALISRLVSLIPWPDRRQAMGDVTLTILDGKPRVAEEVFGWRRSSVSVGINDFRSGIVCVKDLSSRHKPKSEEKNPGLLDYIRRLLEPSSQAEPRLRTTLLYANTTVNVGDYSRGGQSRGRTAVSSCTGWQSLRMRPD